MPRGLSRSTSSKARAGAPPEAAGRFELLQVVYTRRALPELGLQKGEHGTVVELVDQPRLAYLVEFVDEDGRTRQLAELTPEQLAAAPPAP